MDPLLSRIEALDEPGCYSVAFTLGTGEDRALVIRMRGDEPVVPSANSLPGWTPGSRIATSTIAVVRALHQARQGASGSGRSWSTSTAAGTSASATWCSHRRNAQLRGARRVGLVRRRGVPLRNLRRDRPLRPPVLTDAFSGSAACVEKGLLYGISADLPVSGTLVGSGDRRAPSVHAMAAVTASRNSSALLRARSLRLGRRTPAPAF